MLMRFSVSNYLSFPHKIDMKGNISPVQFSMYAGRTEHFMERIILFKERKVLKFGSVYGANAAGKSNLVRAIESGQQIVLNGLDDLNIDNYYCRNVEDNKNHPTFFEYEFSIGERCFAFGFTVNLSQKTVLTEWLNELENKRETTIYERDVESSLYYFDENYFSDSDSIEEFHFYMKDANRIKTSLLLHELERRHLEEEDYQLFHKIYEWFKKKLVIIYPETKIGDSYFRFRSDNKKLIHILNYLDTGITGYTMQDMNEKTFREYFQNPKLADKILLKNYEDTNLHGKSVLKYQNTLFELEFTEGKVQHISKLLFQHGNEKALFDYGEESDGTQRLIELLEIILNDDEERTFVIDELDRSLHPQMTRKFVETFFNFSRNLKTQLITTTHESSIMDLSLLRRDEIWFAERENDHSTKLYPLEKFKTRYDKVVSKAYLDGRYGAVPVFKDFEYVFGRGEFETLKFKNS